jgi:uncharacterized protein DUF4260
MWWNSDLTFRKFPWATKGSSLVLRVECFLVLIITIYAFYELAGNWWLFAAVMIGVDLFLLGYTVNNHVGGMVYNIGHSYILPRLILIVSLFGNFHGPLLFALAWNAHISLDRALGYGLKHETFHLTHLGPIGKAKK